MDFNENDVFRMEFKNITPLLQIDTNGTRDITTKKMYKKIDGFDTPIAVPIFSSNGLRGLMRRLGLKLIADIAKKNGYEMPKLSPDDMNFYASGADNTVKSILQLNYEETEKLRELVPNISLFGAGLSLIEGKTAVSELTPREEFLTREVKDENGDKIVKKNNLIGKISSVRFDETSRISALTPLLDLEDVERWKEFITNNNEAKAEMKKDVAELKKKINAEKKKDDPDQDKINEWQEEIKKRQDETKDEKTQTISAKEYVVPNVVFNGFVMAKSGFCFTDIEKGMLLSIFSMLSVQQIGSSKKDGFGIGEWRISNSAIGDIVTTADKDYLLEERKKEFTGDVQKYIDDFEKWVVENRVWEYIPLDKLVKKVKK